MTKVKNVGNRIILVPAKQSENVETKISGRVSISESAVQHLPTQRVTIGQIVRIEGGNPVVKYSGCLNKNGIVAQTIVPVTAEKFDKQALLSFVNDNPELPVIVGFLIESAGDNSEIQPVKVEIDAERLFLTAEREIVLKCGEASLTLTHAGKVIIKGAYVLSRSTGYNKIKGAAVDIN